MFGDLTVFQLPGWPHELVLGEGEEEREREAPAAQTVVAGEGGADRMWTEVMCEARWRGFSHPDLNRWGTGRTCSGT